MNYNRKIDDFSLVELKAMAYDAHTMITNHTNSLRILEQEIQTRSEQEHKKQMEAAANQAPPAENQEPPTQLAPQ